jgi:hypothetical protein
VGTVTGSTARIGVVHPMPQPAGISQATGFGASPSGATARSTPAHPDTVS